MVPLQSNLKRVLAPFKCLPTQLAQQLKVASSTQMQGFLLHKPPKPLFILENQ